MDRKTEPQHGRAPDASPPVVTAVHVCKTTGRICGGSGDDAATRACPCRIALSARTDPPRF